MGKSYAVSIEIFCPRSRILCSRRVVTRSGRGGGSELDMVAALGVAALGVAALEWRRWGCGKTRDRVSLASRYNLPGHVYNGTGFFPPDPPAVSSQTAMAYRTFVHWAALTSCLCVMSSAAAQTTTVPGSNTVTEFKGSLKGFQRGVLVVTRDDGTDVMVQLPDDISSFNFVATAKPAFLRRGTMVRFSGMFGPGGVALAPIRQIEVFQPIPAAKIVGRLRERYVPGVYVDRAQQPQQAMAKYYIVGNLMGVAPGMMMVQAGKGIDASAAGR